MDKELIPSSNQNSVTGDHLITKASSPAYRAGWDRIFGAKEDSLDVQPQSDQTSECSHLPKEAGS